MQHLFRARGIRNLDWRAGTQRQATPGVNGATLALTPTEYAIVELLVRRSPAVVSRDTIANHAWTDALDPIASNSIDVHVTRLRAKLVGAGLRLEAVRGVGYRLVERGS